MKKKAAAQPITFNELIQSIGFREQAVDHAPVTGAKNFWTAAKAPKHEFRLSIVRRPTDFVVVVAAAPKAAKHETIELPCQIVGADEVLTRRISERLAIANRIVNSHRWCSCGGTTKLQKLSKRPYLHFACNADGSRKGCTGSISLPGDLPPMLAPLLSPGR